MIHYKSVNPEDYKDIGTGKRKFIIIRNSRNFVLSDKITFVEINDGMETGRIFTTGISHIITDRQETGIRRGFLILMLKML